MLFHSFSFLLAFAAFLVLWPLLKGELRVAYLTLFSYLFYAWWYPPYLVLIIGFTLFAHYGALPKLSTVQFRCLLVISLLPLCFYKYTGFIIHNLNTVLQTAWEVPKWRLPLGISFITFTVIAYLVDTRRGIFPPTHDLKRTALYLSFFPHLIAGPIMRPKELFPQFNHLRIKNSLAKMGVLLFSLGVVKKVIFADQIAYWVDTFYPADTVANAARSLFAFYAFPVQIYCDFSGYTDMALGLAFILGVRLPLNFNRPYIAESIRDFWRRWHITLSRWLRDYLYIPLGGSRHGKNRTLFALLATMILGGLWHGSSWTFVLWGAYHGILLVGEHLNKNRASPKSSFWKKLLTFHLIALGWVLFRAHNYAEVSHWLAGFSNWGGWQEVFSMALFPVILIAVFFILHRWDRVSLVCWFARRHPTSLTYTLAVILFLVSKILSVGNPSAFIYFDF